MKWDHLFEWHLIQQMGKQSLEVPERKERRRVFKIEKTDINSLHLAYNLRGELSLADIRPTGFLLRSKL